MKIFDVKNHVPIYNWMGMNSPDEWGTLEYAKKAALLPWAYHHVALMPDGHIGVGPAVGSVIAMKDAVSPAAVGVDIGCGMGAIRYNLKAEDLPDTLTPLRRAIERIIPVGFESHKQVPTIAKKDALWDRFDTLTPGVHKLREKAALQCGSLGGGNHFVEIALDNESNVWVLLHSGSRNIGKVIAEKHITKAKDLVHNNSLEDKNFAVFLANTPEFAAYVNDLHWAQEYAFLNRRVMLFLIDIAIQNFFAPRTVMQVGNPILCHHNYVSYENHYGENVYVTRKGAIRAGKGELGLIPGSMGTKSFIVRGLGNPDSFMSASHGAGRRMSRGQAKRTFTVEDLRAQTAGVECRKDAAVLDELPSAYKDITEVMANQADLVEVVTELKQVLCIKG